MSGQRILVVDDSPFTGEALALALRKQGFVVQVAYDMVDLEASDLVVPDLVFMDVVLQEAYGDDVAGLLRWGRGFECPIVLISSLPDAELAKRSEEAGLDGFVSKRAGLAAAVAHAQRVLGDATGPILPTSEITTRFEITARQRVRRMLHVASEPAYWNHAALVAEMHALAGDADLAGDRVLADTARACRDVASRLGGNDRMHEMSSAIEPLVQLVRAGTSVAGRILVIDATNYSRVSLLPVFDQNGHVVVEARTLAEARQKLHAAAYNAIVVDSDVIQALPGLMDELAMHLPGVPQAILSDGPVPGHETVLLKQLGPTALVAAIERLLER